MKSVRIQGKVKENDFIPDYPKNYQNALRVFNGLDVVITISKPTKERSNPQNNYLWGVPYKLIADYTGNTTEDVHHEMGNMFLSEKTTSPIPKIKTTTKLTTTEFSEYVENIIKWAAEFLGLYIPLPNEKEMWSFLEDK
jgi:hypothetical protein